MYLIAIISYIDLLIDHQNQVNLSFFQHNLIVWSFAHIKSALYSNLDNIIEYFLSILV